MEYDTRARFFKIKVQFAPRKMHYRIISFHRAQYDSLATNCNLIVIRRTTLARSSCKCYVMRRMSTYRRLRTHNIYVKVPDSLVEHKTLFYFCLFLKHDREDFSVEYFYGFENTKKKNVYTLNMQNYAIMRKRTMFLHQGMEELNTASQRFRKSKKFVPINISILSKIRIYVKKKTR